MKPNNEKPEQRSSPRVQVEVPINVCLRSAQVCTRVETVDLSYEGFGLYIAEPAFRGTLAKGEVLSFQTEEDFFCLRGLAQIRWIDLKHGRVGMSLLEPGVRGSKLLREFVSLCTSGVGVS